MGVRSRIRWPKVAKLSLAVLGGLALFAGLPSLIRRPEPPPLEPDIGLAPLAASQVPAPSGLQPGPGTERHTAKETDRRRPRATQRRRRDPRRPARREEDPPSTPSPATGVSTPAAVPVIPSVPVAAAPPPSAPPPAPPTPPTPTRPPASQPAAASEFGFER